MMYDLNRKTKVEKRKNGLDEIYLKIKKIINTFGHASGVCHWCAVARHRGGKIETMVMLTKENQRVFERSFEQKTLGRERNFD